MENGEGLNRYLSMEPSVESIFSRVALPALLKSGKTAISGTGQGIEAEKEARFFHGLKIIAGEPLTSRPFGILLGIGLAKALGVKPGDPITLIANSIDGEISEAEFIVTGISETGSLDFDNRMFRVQLTAAQSLLKTDRIETIALGLTADKAWDSFSSRFEEKFPGLEVTSFAVLDKVYYQHSVDWLQAQFKVIQLIILSIVLLGIFNSVSSSVLERKQEIGNFRANGESVMDIMGLITLEGIFLGFLGSVIGIVTTYIILTVFLNNGILMPPGPGLTNPFYISFEFEWEMVYASLGLTTIAAIIASLLAGVRIAKMPIANALRSI